MTKDELKAAMYEVLDERVRIDVEMHGDHHAWIQAHIEKEQARNEMLFSVAKAVAQWSVLGLLGAIWYYFQNGHWPS
jgi:hypothetical protein